MEAARPQEVLDTDILPPGNEDVSDGQHESLPINIDRYEESIARSAPTNVREPSPPPPQPPEFSSSDEV